MQMSSNNSQASDSKMPRRCPRCLSDETTWIRLPPESMPRFRVQCRRDGTYLKWGTEGQLAEARRQGLKVEERLYETASPKPSLEKFLSPTSDTDSGCEAKG